jgi:hypothetical protein
MNFDDDLPVFMADFGVDAITAGMTMAKKVIFNKPDEVIFDGMQTSADFTIRYLTSEFTAMHDKTAITVDGSNYKIRGEPLLIADGKFSLASLHK